MNRTMHREPEIRISRRKLALGVKDLMAVTGLGCDSVKSGIISGQLPGYKVGRRYVVPPDAFDSFCVGEWKPALRPQFEEPIRAIPGSPAVARAKRARGGKGTEQA